jgi:RND superfamily putative drug exporter
MAWPGGQSTTSWARSWRKVSLASFSRRFPTVVTTAAALIMIFVFGSFLFGGTRVIEEVGIGFASAVLLDAFVIRTVLVPALMHLFGRANWWLPGWLDRILPHLNVEPAPVTGLAEVPQPVASGR